LLGTNTKKIEKRTEKSLKPMGALKPLNMPKPSGKKTGTEESYHGYHGRRVGEQKTTRTQETEVGN
jgi:hypothetical protein